MEGLGRNLLFKQLHGALGAVCASQDLPDLSMGV